MEESKRGIPIIGRIPVLGALFSNRENVKTNTETIVLIRPTVLGADSKLVDDETISIIEDIEEGQGLKSEALNDEMDMFFN